MNTVYTNYLAGRRQQNNPVQNRIISLHNTGEKERKRCYYYYYYYYYFRC